MFEMHILLHLACAEEAEIWCNHECFIAYSAPKERLSMSTDGVSWRKVQSAQLVSILSSFFLCFRDQLYLWIDFFFSFFCTIWAGFHKHGWYYDGSGKGGLRWKGQDHGVRGDTSKSMCLCLHSAHIPRSVFQLTGFHILTCFFYASG